ncbi:MAG TPA: thioether cross-link-forming SCIFF peptide maturase [Bacillota bacterium]|nr:thioether cross-link-forming SCIFF peptide maturase [Bacillota bacterium]HOK69068.1 thioether cross-link-forming SCIFF peptide maturase [Bacillota bacterium]HPP85097.1 thioether cross-link-forming SCIFF peptide maturase [Bacillota bacterium]
MVHCYKLNGYNIVIDGNSGAIHSVDDVAFDIISLYESAPKDEIIRRMLEKYKDRADVNETELNEVFDDIEALKKQGKLFAEDIYAGMAIDFKKRASVVKALCLHIAHDCNLACEYCFAGKGEYHGDRSLMSFEVGKAALDFLIQNSGARTNLEVDFFGGEPLLNFEVVKKIVAYGREQEKKHKKNFRFTLTTNGILLDDEAMDFANREMSNVVLSLDGRKEVHDRFRTYRNGKGSYDVVLPKFKKMADLRGQKNYYIRGTYTHFNTDFSNDILHMADLGFKEISVEPVVAPPTEPYALTEEDVPKLCEQYEILAAEMRKRQRKGSGFTFYHYMIDLDKGPCIVKRLSGCGVGTEYMAVTPAGELYPCHQFVGDKKFLLGNVFDGITNTELRDQFKLCNVYAKKDCADCFAHLYCGGGCAANSYHASGDINGTYKIGCDLHRKRIECAVMLKVAEAFPND